MAKKRKGRGRLSSIDLLPEECDPIIVWAAGELSNRKRTQSDIHIEFTDKMQELKDQSLGKFDFEIPSFSAFNRYSVRLAITRQKLDETRRIAAALSKDFDPKASDEVAMMAAQAIKTLVFDMITYSGEGAITSKDAVNLANALRGAIQAQNVSSQLRSSQEADFNKRADKAISKVAKELGMPAKEAAFWRRKVLGVRPPEKPDEKKE